MNCHDFLKLNRKTLFEHFERERQQLLKAGMSEADIFRIHFGEPEDDSYSDYRAWLSERRHRRNDHKYAPGEPISIDTLKRKDKDKRLIDCNNSVSYMELTIDVERAMATMTKLQREYFKLIRLSGYRKVEVAKLYGKDEAPVRRAITVADKKIEKYFSAV